MKLAFYHFQNANLLQAILGIFAGICATKAADSSQELKRLLKVPELQNLLSKADEAASRRQQEEARYHNLVESVRFEAQQQYARDMLRVHREQLLIHWTEIQNLQTMLATEESLDPEIRKHILNFIVRTNYIGSTGRNFLQQIPIIGGFLHFLFGPIWEVLYTRNIGRINRSLLAKGQNSADPTPPTDSHLTPQVEAMPKNDNRG